MDNFHMFNHFRYQNYMQILLSHAETVRNHGVQRKAQVICEKHSDVILCEAGLPLALGLTMRPQSPGSTGETSRKRKWVPTTSPRGGHHHQQPSGSGETSQLRTQVSVTRPIKQPARKPEEKAQSSTIAPEDLPEVISQDSLPSGSENQPSFTASCNEPLMMFGHTVEEYQAIYQEVVDPMLRTKSGRLRSYSVELGLQIKKKLWKRLGRPQENSVIGENGLVQVEMSYGDGHSPPWYNIDTPSEMTLRRR